MCSKRKSAWDGAMAQIYGLFSARNGIVRYVGQTAGACADRFKQHKREAEGEPTTRRHKWFHTEWRDGYPVRCVLLQSCNDGARHQIETEWIRKFPNLLNEQKHNPWAWIYSRVGKAPEVPGIAAYMRGHIFNVEGFRGVHYSRQLDRYFVLIYTGRGAEWLCGDEIPGHGKEGGNVYFADLAAAVNARDDERRRWQSMNWLPARGP